VVPLTEQSRARRDECAEVVRAECLLRVSSDDEVEFQRLGHQASHPLYERLRKEGHPALVLFSSGSTGPMKAAVHDFGVCFEVQDASPGSRTLTFLLYDHIGGTLLYSLSNASCMITVPDRLPDTVCAAVQDYAVEVLPVSPSFLALLILSQAYERYDLSSLKVITYGAEVMPESTLRRCHKLFPGVELLQSSAPPRWARCAPNQASDSTW
jgi:acyl-coenzyme A synthetase/AMP-(fatty) acid ligase